MQKVLLILMIPLMCACATLKKPFYYEAKKDNLNIKILGTMHYGFGISELPNFIISDLENSTAFAGELNQPHGDNSVESIKKSYIDHHWNRFVWNREKDLKANGFYTKEEWQQIESIIDKQALIKDKQDYAYLPPILVHAIISPKKVVAYVPRSQAYGLHEFLDEQIFAKAKSEKKNLIVLDKTNAISDECSDSLYAALIKKTLFLDERAFTEMAVRNLDAIYRAYESGEESEIAKVINESQDPELGHCMLKERNKLWVQRIKNTDRHNFPLFIAVGVGHLVDDQSLLNLLKEDGFEIRRITER